MMDTRPENVIRDEQLQEQKKALESQVPKDDTIDEHAASVVKQVPDNPHPTGPHNPFPFVDAEAAKEDNKYPEDNKIESEKKS